MGVDAKGVGRYVATLRLSPNARQLIYVRDFRFGENETILFPVDHYAGVKKVFDTVHDRDGHQLTLFRPADGE